MKRKQPAINPALLCRLCRVSEAFEMTAEKMLNFILAVSLEELDGMQDDLTVCVPAPGTRRRRRPPRGPGPPP